MIFVQKSTIMNHWWHQQPKSYCRWNNNIKNNSNNHNNNNSIPIIIIINQKNKKNRRRRITPSTGSTCCIDDCKNNTNYIFFYYNYYYHLLLVLLFVILTIMIMTTCSTRTTTATTANAWMVTTTPIRGTRGPIIRINNNNNSVLRLSTTRKQNFAHITSSSAIIKKPTTRFYSSSIDSFPPKSSTTSIIIGSSSSSSSSSNEKDDDDNIVQAVLAPKKFIPYPFDYHQEIIVRIETLTNRGWGIGRVILSKNDYDDDTATTTTTTTTTYNNNNNNNEENNSEENNNNSINKNQQQQQHPTRSNRSKNRKNKHRKKKDDDGNNNNNYNSYDVVDDDEEQQQQQMKFLFDDNDDNEDEKENDDSDDDNVKITTSSMNEKRKKWVIMVPNVIPGELVQVRIFRNYNNYSEGDLIKIIESSSNRIQPKCIYFNECGGCQLQHMTIETQRVWKTIHVEQAMKQYNILHNNDNIPITVQECIGTNEIYYYRSKLTPHYQAPNKKSISRMIEAIGFQKRTSRAILDIESCIIATHPVNTKYQQIRNELLSQPTNRTKGATLLFRQANLQHDANDDANDNIVTTNHKEYITTNVNNIQFTYQAGNFFQNNYYVLPIMIEHVVYHACKPNIYTGRNMTHLIDCYCGSGLFALSTAQYFHTVIGIEVNEQAINEAIMNAHNNNITNCQFIAASASTIFDNIQNIYPKNQTVVIIDPPRKGCTIEFLQQLYKFGPNRIVYMSCDPITQARDASNIVNTGQYHITSVQPFDLFPQTRHIECLMIFEKNQ